MTGGERCHATLNELVEREIVPALDGVGPAFDVDGFVQALRDRGLVVYVTHPGAAQRDGFRLTVDDEGQTPGFWGLVERFDTDAATVEQPRRPAMSRPILACHDHAHGGTGAAVVPRLHHHGPDGERIEHGRFGRCVWCDRLYPLHDRAPRDVGQTGGVR